MLQYIIDHWIEIFGVISGLLFLYFEIKANIWLWPVSIVSAIAYIIVFYSSKFYADMGLQVYYFIVSIYGWIYWVKHGNNGGESVPIISISKKQIFLLSATTLIIFIIIQQILLRFTDSPLPGWDAFTTALSITATWMLARKIIEQWLVWIVVDFVSLSLYIYKELYFTAFLFFVYGTMAIYGYYEWKKMKNQAYE